MEELKECSLNATHSFYVQEWLHEFGDTAKLSKRQSEKANADIMLTRVKLVYAYLKQSFEFVSGIYTGKTQDFNSRFVKHEKMKRKANHCMIMIAVGVFKSNDVPDDLKERLEMSVDVLGLNYERMLSTRVIHAGLRVFGERNEAAGGGRASSTLKDEVAVYMLVVVSNGE